MRLKLYHGMRIGRPVGLLSASAAYTAGPAPQLTVRAYAGGYSNHSLQLSVGATTQNYTTYYGDSVLNITKTIAHSDINSNNTAVQLNGLSSL